MKQTNEEQIQELKAQLEKMERSYLNMYNSACTERDEYMMKSEDLEAENKGLQTAINQLLSAFLFNGPLTQEAIEQIAAENHLKLATVSSQRKAVAKYYRPKEESES